MSSATRKSVIDIIDKRDAINEKLLKSRKSLVDYESLDNCLTHNESGSKRRFNFRQRSLDNMSSKQRLTLRQKSIEKMGDSEITTKDLKQSRSKRGKTLDMNPNILLRINDSSAQNLETPSHLQKIIA